jgi:hypothetical protein
MRKVVSSSETNTVSRHHIQAGKYRSLDLKAAHDLLPIVRKITQQANRELGPIQQRLNSMVPADPRIAYVKFTYERIVKNWAGKIERLGLKVHGLWQVGFDGEIGWYGWQYPERSIRYFLEYDALFADRSLIRHHQHIEGRNRLLRK